MPQVRSKLVGELQFGITMVSLLLLVAGRDADFTDAYSTELQAMIRAVEIAVDLGAIRVVFETDSQLLTLALNRRGPDFSQLAARLHDLKIRLRTWFSCSNVKASRHEANRVAHKLTK
jgi:ribonuclease HI